MLMVDSDIRAAIENKKINIDPCSQDNFKPLSYIARLGERALIGGDELELDIAAKGEMVLKAGEFVLFNTLEKFELSNVIAGHLGIRTALARKGFVLLAGMHIDPGWKGHLVLGGYNASPRKLVLDYEQDIVSIEFHQLTTPPRLKPVISREQLQGKLPSLDKDYLREMETQSLSDLGEDVRRLSQSVERLSEKQEEYLKANEKSMQQMRWFIGIGIALLAVFIAVK